MIDQQLKKYNSENHAGTAKRQRIEYHSAAEEMSIASLAHILSNHFDLHKALSEWSSINSKLQKSTMEKAANMELTQEDQRLKVF